MKRKLILKKSNFASVFVLVVGMNYFLPSVVLRSTKELLDIRYGCLLWALLTPQTKSGCWFS